MDPKQTNELSVQLEKDLKRPLQTQELINMENDALLLARFLLTKVSELEQRIVKLEK